MDNGDERMDRQQLATRLRSHLVRVYGGAADAALARLLEVCRPIAKPHTDAPWSERDAVLITYGDAIRQVGPSPLATLHDWFAQHRLSAAFSFLHILPFCPYSSDDGFSVIDYRQVDPALGNWNDIARLSEQTGLMFDLVLNHISQQSEWFQAYLRGEEKFLDWFIEVDPTVDLSHVVRPRSLSLLTPFDTSRGVRHVWTTFSPDQVDLNYGQPAVLAEMVDTLLYYAERGARIIRLDAIAYLWKELHTPCIHLPQTHEIVKLLRTVLDYCAPGTWLLTETNVPHRENVSYFGDGDEAHLVYQFSLPPLLLDGILHHDASVLQRWLADLVPPAPQTSFLNFTASHDGIGVRPLEGLVPPVRLESLVKHVRRQGGLVSTRRISDGSDAPYELNTTYLDALRDISAPTTQQQRAPFRLSQLVAMSLQGIPAVYFHSLVGSPNDVAGARKSGQPRRINRHKYDWQELEQALADPSNAQACVFNWYRHVLQIRRRLPAFHPASHQSVLDVRNAQVLAVLRGENSPSPICMLANFAEKSVDVPRSLLPQAGDWLYDWLSGNQLNADAPLRLEAYQVRWLGQSGPHS